MAKARITSNNGEGLYGIELEFDSSTLDNQIAALAQQLIDIEQIVLDARVAVIEAEDVRDSLANDLDLAIDAYAAGGESEPVIAATKALAEAVSALNVARFKVQRISGQKLSLAARKTQLENTIIGNQASAGDLVWCADYTDDIANGTIVPVAVPPGEFSAAPWVILPRQHPAGYGGTYDRGLHGQMVPRLSMTPAATFYNWAVLPGWQRWMPTHRIGTLTFVDQATDTCTVTLDTSRSSANPWPYTQGLNVNLSESTATVLSGVPIRYMTCNAAVFEAGDRVLVRFAQPSKATAGPGAWDGAEVIGFVTAPKQCFGIGFHFLYNEPGGTAPMLIRGESGGAWRTSDNVSTNTFFSSALGENQRYPLYTWHGDAPWKWTGIVGKGARQYFQDPDVPWPRVFRVYTVAGPVVVSGLSSFSKDRISAAWFQEVGGVDKLRIVVTRGTSYERIYEIDAETVLSGSYGTRSVSLIDFEQVAEWSADIFHSRNTGLGENSSSGECFLMPWAVNRSGTEMMTMRYMEKEEGPWSRVIMPVGQIVDLSTILAGEISEPTITEYYPTPAESSFHSHIVVDPTITYVETVGGSDIYSGAATTSTSVESVGVLLVGVDYNNDAPVFYRYRQVHAQNSASGLSGSRIVVDSGEPAPTGFNTDGPDWTGSGSSDISLAGYLDYLDQSVKIHEQAYAFSITDSGDKSAYSWASTQTFKIHSLIDIDTRYPEVRHYTLDIEWADSIDLPAYTEDGTPTARTYTIRLKDEDTILIESSSNASRTGSGLPGSLDGGYSPQNTVIDQTYSGGSNLFYSVSATPTTPDLLNMQPASRDVDGLSAQRISGAPGWPLVWSSPLLFESRFEAMKGAAARLPNGDYLTTFPAITVNYATDDPFDDIFNVIRFDSLLRPGGSYAAFWRQHINWQEAIFFNSSVLTETEINTLTERTEPQRWRVYDIVSR